MNFNQTFYCRLKQARADWLDADWQSLVNIDLTVVDNHAEASVLAPLVAIAHLEIGNLDKARELFDFSVRSGAEKKYLSKVLLALVLFSLGRANLIINQNSRALEYFALAISLMDAEVEPEFQSEIKAVQELARLGLLPQSVNFISGKINLVKEEINKGQGKKVDSRLKVLETELELIQHELSLAIQKQQLYPNKIKTSHGQPGNSDDWKEKLKKISPSQLGQDLWVLERTGYKQGGFFVEFGASDGVLLSNTWLLEHHMGWQGICAEPNPGFYDRLQRNRKCILTNSCIGPRTGEVVDFVLAEEYGGMVQDMGRDMHADKREAYFSQKSNRTQFFTESLDDMLRRLRAPRVIDYLSIDTEGSELAILENFPFENWLIKLITVEHNFTEDRERLRRLLASKGYACVEADWDDWYELNVGD